MKTDAAHLSFMDRLISRAVANNHYAGRIALLGKYQCDLFRGGELVDQWEQNNLVTDEGIDDLFEQYFNGSAYTAAHYVGLIDDTGGPAPAITDTLATHGTWLELTTYDEANRPALTMAAASGTVIATSAASVFTISASDNYGGAFIATVPSGTTGTLFSAAAFAAVRALVDNDVLNVTYSLDGNDV